MIKEVF